MSEYHPLELTEEVKNIVVRGDDRKYYRFRETKFYGGIATADCVGCNLSCHFCWSKKPKSQPENVGDFYSPNEVREKLVNIAEKNDYHQVRISGNEPTIGKKHLLSLLEMLEGSGLLFVLETNGVLLGKHPQYVEELEDFENIHVRVSLKGCNPTQFSKLTGAESMGFELQIQALRNLIKSKISCNPAIIKDFTTKETLSELRKTLRRIDISLVRNLEFERLKTYPHVKKQLKKAGIEPRKG